MEEQISCLNGLISVLKRIDLRFNGTDLRPEQAAHEQYVVSNNHLPTLQDYD